MTAIKAASVQRQGGPRPIRQSNVRPVSQVIVTVPSMPGDGRFEVIQQSCLRWLGNRAGRPLPQAAIDGGAFELEEVGTQRAGAVALDSPRYWVARLDDADREVPQRIWVTEVSLAQASDTELRFGVRLTCVSRGARDPYVPSIPGFVRPLLLEHGATLDGRSIADFPWLVSDSDGVEQLASLIENPDRDADVIVLALPEESEDPSQTAASAIEIHRRALGAAHVVVLTGPASFILSDRLGRNFSVFKQGVRTYLPGFDADRDQPFRHPLGLPQRIADWPEGGAEGYAQFVIGQSLGRFVSRPDNEQRLPPYADIRRLAARRQLTRARKEGSSERELMRLLEEDNVRLSKALDEEKNTALDTLAEAWKERDAALEAAAQAKATADALRRRLEGVENRLQSLSKQAAATPIPRDLRDFEVWCDKHLSGNVEVLNRAFRGVKDSIYQDPTLLYRALLLLRDHYVPMRRQGGEQLRAAFVEQCAALQLDESASFSGEGWGMEGDTYIVAYAGKNRLIDRHLTRGNSRDPRHCFRLYFFWDDEGGQAVVGWLPSHLDNRLT